MDAASAVEFCVIFVFEVYVEKELYLLGTRAASWIPQPESKPAIVPIAGEPTENDVLFGRGG